MPIIENMKIERPPKYRAFAGSSRMYPSEKTWTQRPMTPTMESIRAARSSNLKPSSTANDPNRNHSTEPEKRERPNASSSPPSAANAAAATETTEAAVPRLLRNSAMKAAEASGARRTLSAV